MNTERHSEKVLLVDDTPSNLRLLSVILTRQGYIVKAVRNGAAALKTAKIDTPDIILLDIMMPEMNGYDVCIKLKAQQETRDIPVIFVSALNESVDKVKGFRVGGVDYVTKPYQIDEVLARIETHLAIRKLQQQLEAKNRELEKEVKKRRRTEIALQKANSELRKLANLDGLTRIPNRRQFDRYLSQQWQKLVVAQAPLTVMLADIDYFKLYNDTYGHIAGDDCLRQVATALNEAVSQPENLVARYGGEEFAVILPRTNLERAETVAAAIQQRILALNIQHEPSKISSRITLSLGVSCFTPHKSLSPTVLVATADKALYQAKKAGRNRVVFKAVSLADIEATETKS